MSSVPVPPPSYTTYDEDGALGKPVPSLETLKYVHGEPVSLDDDALTCIFFWAKFAKGDYVTVCSISDLKTKFPALKIVGISCDPNEEDATKFVGKLGQAMPEIHVDKLRADYSLAWDGDKTVKNAFTKVAGYSVGVSCVFLVKNKTIIWKEQFSQGHLVPKGQLEEQIRRGLAGEDLIKNGPRPADDDDDDDDNMFGDDDDDDDDLGFSTRIRSSPSSSSTVFVFAGAAGITGSSGKGLSTDPTTSKA
eukprot:m.166204 g.166204  ORF g.166204 m.166204 type:complete len:249 (-) comp25005_c1_seq2:1619-2365(-)